MAQNQQSTIKNLDEVQWGAIEQIASDVNSGNVSAAENVERALALTREKQQYNAIISTLADRARLRAQQIDEKVARGENAGRLAGVPFIAKDNFLTFGGDTTAASNILRGFEAPYQSTAIERLEAEGAICVAKANLDAFAHGSSTENSDFGTTLNPRDPSKVPGGSSGGSAAAVVLGIVPFALGTDTGGSIRLPASFCGAVGYKPTYGLVSRYGVVAMASSTDVIGPLARTVEDAAVVLDVMAGKDPRDSTTIDRQDCYVPGPRPAATDSRRKVGVVKEFFDEGVQPDVRAAVEAQIDAIKKAGHDIVEVSIPSIGLALACYYIIVPAEVSSNLSRYDGQRYGYSASTAQDLHDSFSQSRGTGFNAENKRRILIGTYVLSSGYYDAYYKKAAKLRTKLIHEFNEAFTHVDLLVGPTAPMTAFAIGDNTDDPLQMYLADIMTVAVNLVGVPAISVPCPTKGLPIGLQIIAPARSDASLLAFAQSITEGN
jgi:aspartyl-tRNA(Asn)/glutamyl-tRNA(Gln) amidotransferase subunit A